MSVTIPGMASWGLPWAEPANILLDAWLACPLQVSGLGTWESLLPPSEPFAPQTTLPADAFSSCSPHREMRSPLTSRQNS